MGPNLRVRPSCSSGWCAGLVVAGGVEDQFAQEFAGLGVDDADVAVDDQEQNVGAGVDASEADGVQPAVVAQGEDAAGVDAVAADARVGWWRVVGRGGSRAGCVGGGGGAPEQGTAGAVVGVALSEPVEQ